MKQLLSILCLSSLFIFSASGQDKQSRAFEEVEMELTKHTKSLLKLSNKTTSFFVTNPVRFKDSTGTVVSVRSIVELEGRYMKKIKNLYGKELAHNLVILLNDTTRDWAANVMLYAIYEVSFDRTGLTAEQLCDPGIVALTDVVDADEHYSYSVADKAEARLQKIDTKTGEKVGDPSTKTGTYTKADMAAAGTGVVSLSTQKYGPDEQGKIEASDAIPASPKNAGELTIPASFQWETKVGEKKVSQDRSSIVLHEMSELYIWTHNKTTNYEAHKQSAEVAKKLPADDKRRGTSPGNAAVKQN